MESTGQSFKIMAITINGNGTVTGISVGGLPDGIVDTDMLAANAVTAAKADQADFGKVGKVVVGTTSGSGFTTSGTHTDWQDCGLSASITPQATSSEILVLCSMNGMVCHYDDYDAVSIRVLDNSGTSIAEVINAGYQTNDDHLIQGVALHALSSPSSTSALTYHVEVRNRQANAITVDQSGASRCRLVLMELLGGAA